MHRLLVFGMLILALGLGVAAWQLAREQREFHELRDGYFSQVNQKDRENTGMLSLQEIIRQMDLPDQVRILEVETEKKHGKIYYEIELLLPGGIVEERRIDSHTGRIIKRQREKEEVNFR